MTKIRVDETLRSKLHNLTEALELVDDRGRLLGRFLPAIDLSGWQPLSPDIDEAELDRREKAGEKRYTTAEVLDHLKPESRK